MNQDERNFWEMAACAALRVNDRTGYESALIAAADAHFADCMMVEWRKRFYKKPDAPSEAAYLSFGTEAELRSWVDMYVRTGLNSGYNAERVKTNAAAIMDFACKVRSWINAGCRP